MAKKYNLPSLEFDSSGSATIRFFGKIVSVGLHYADAKTALTKMICPDSIDNSLPECNLCAVESASPRMISIGWDCNKAKWVLYMAPVKVYQEIMKQCKPLVSAQMMENGEGPDVVLQRIGTSTEVAIMSETLGVKRGIWKDTDNWGPDVLDENKVKIPDFPDPLLVLEQIRQNSHWKTYHSTEQLVKDYPKAGPKPMPGFLGLGNVINYHQAVAGPVGPIGPIGYSGATGYSGITGTSGYSYVSPYKVMAQAPKPPDGALPKAKIFPSTEKKEKPEVKKIDDRWDVV